MIGYTIDNPNFSKMKGSEAMSDRELAKNLIDNVPESKLFYIIGILRGASIPDDTPNAETLEAIREITEMKEMGTGQHFSGSTADFFKMLEDE